MKVISLVFDYDLDKVSESGRAWGYQAYKNKNFIFEYSAASYATFLHHNPNLEYTIDTDDPDLLWKHVKKYNVELKNLNIQNSLEEIQQWKSHDYCFWPLAMHRKKYVDLGESILKLDNDLTCLKPIDDLLDFTGALVWKYERNVNEGRETWGERYVCREALGTEDFPLWNIGVLGIGKDHLNIIDECIESSEKLISVDASSVISYKEAPGKKFKMWVNGEQTAMNWAIYNNNIKVQETYDYFNHHCYGFNVKKNVIESAKFLEK
tara:strand:- start:304 stop:1098 length:795 start_codon:yes stop_codon:yes gene_type:complete